MALSATDPDGDPLAYSATAQSLAYVLDAQLGLRTDRRPVRGLGRPGREVDAGPRRRLVLHPAQRRAVPLGRQRAGHRHPGRHPGGHLPRPARPAVQRPGGLRPGLCGPTAATCRRTGAAGARSGCWTAATAGTSSCPTAGCTAGTAAARPPARWSACRGPSYHADPALLHDAQAGQPHAAVSVIGRTLTIDREDGFVGAVVVTVTASDGRGGTDSKTFTVTVRPSRATARRCWRRSPTGRSRPARTS